MKNYDSTKLSKYIEYLDKNNFYGWAMKIVQNSSIRYILEVDLEYPDELYVLHNDYRLAPEKLAILYDVLSDYCKKIADEYGMTKLIIYFITEIFSCICL